MLDWIKNNVHNVLIFFLLLIAAMILGMTIVNVVDKRLSEVTIKIPKQNVVVNLPSNNNINDQVETFVSNSSENVSANTLKAPLVQSKNTVVGCTSDTECNMAPWQNGENVCLKNNKCQCTTGTGTFCQNGPTNYPDPKDMSETDRKIFKITYPRNMTLQDYINWLWLYKEDPDDLTIEHRKNFEAIKKGIHITYADKPSAKEAPPLTSEQYFEKMYDLAGQVNWRTPLNMDTNGLVGYNYNDYSEFNQNFDQLGSSGIASNPSSLPIKHSAKVVDNMVRRPINTTQIDNKERNMLLRSKMTHQL